MRSTLTQARSRILRSKTLGLKRALQINVRSFTHVFCESPTNACAHVDAQAQVDRETEPRSSSTSTQAENQDLLFRYRGKQFRRFVRGMRAKVATYPHLLSGPENIHIRRLGVRPGIRLMPLR